MVLQGAGARPPELVGGFKLVRELGGGRPGTWVARRKNDGELVVLHRVPSGGRGATILAEARRALEIDHPCVVRIRSVEAAASDILVTTDFLDGELYSGLLVAARDQGAVVPVPVALRIICDVLAGLAAMHGATIGAKPVRVVYGRLAPVDIQVGVDGVSRVVVGARLSRGDDGRTLSYFAPEIVLSGEADIDERTDVYGAGVLLWEALARRRLYEASSSDVLLSKQLRGQVAAPPTPADAPWAAGLGAVAVRALATDPKDRYISAPSMLEALLEAAGRRVGTAGDVATFIEGLVGPFIRARRREVTTSLQPSDSDIRATTPDRDEPTLGRLADDDDREIATEVDFKSPELLRRMTADAADDGDEPRTQVDVPLTVPHDPGNDEPTLHPADREQRTRKVQVPEIPIASTRRPTQLEDPSVTSMVPPTLQRVLLARQKALSEDSDPTRVASEGVLPCEIAREPLTKSIPTTKKVPEAAQTAPEEQGGGVPNLLPRAPLESVITIDTEARRDEGIVTRQRMPGEDYGEPSIVTAQRPSPALDVPAPERERTSDLRDVYRAEDDGEEFAPTTAKERPRDRGALIDPGVARTVSILQEEVRMAGFVEQTLDMPKPEALRAMIAQQKVMKTQPIPPGQRFPASGQGSAERMQAPQMVAPPAAHLPPPPAVAMPVAPPSQPFLPSGSPSLAEIDERRPGSSAFLGIFTFLFVVASLGILAWLTFPYWRAWANL